MEEAEAAAAKRIAELPAMLRAGTQPTRNWKSLAWLLKQHGTRHELMQSLVRAAAKKGDAGGVSKLLAEGAGVNDADADGWT